MRRLLIDTDTASDDAVALVMALQDPAVHIEAITVVAGNVALDQAVQNALYTVELCGASVPVHAGADRPLRRPLDTAEHVHGADGMGDIGLPLRGREPAGNDAVSVLIETINRYAGEMTLVTLGPLTNIALALERDPSIATKVAACYLMGGVGQGSGNITPVAEYNIWTDPEAARIVFASALPIHMIGWDIAHGYANFTADEAAALRGIGTPLAEFSIDIQATVAALDRGDTPVDGFTLPDPTTMAVALDPSIATDVRHLYVEVEATSELCRGQTVVDHVGVTGLAPNTHVVLEIDRERFVELLRRSVS